MRASSDFPNFSASFSSIRRVRKLEIRKAPEDPSKFAQRLSFEIETYLV